MIKENTKYIPFNEHITTVKTARKIFSISIIEELINGDIQSQKKNESIVLAQNFSFLLWCIYRDFSKRKGSTLNWRVQITFPRSVHKINNEMQCWFIFVKCNNRKSLLSGSYVKWIYNRIKRKKNLFFFDELVKDLLDCIFFITLTHTYAHIHTAKTNEN